MTVSSARHFASTTESRLHNEYHVVQPWERDKPSMVDELLLRLNGALARPNKKTASTACPTISVTSAYPTLIGIFQPLVRFR